MAFSGATNYTVTKDKVMLTVLITGSMGAGKSSVIALLKGRNFPVFKADIQAKKLLKAGSACHLRLKEIFTDKSFYLPSGCLNSKKLAQSLFSNSEKRKAVEAIIHPLVRQSFEQFVQRQKKRGRDRVFYEAPLINQKIFNSFEKVILITCPKSIKKKRLIKQGWIFEEIRQRWMAQISDSQVKNKADFIIDNSGDFQNLKKQIEKILYLLDSSLKKTNL